MSQLIPNEGKSRLKPKIELGQTCAPAMITKGMQGVVDVLFDSIQGDHEAGFLVNKKGTPQRHALDMVIFYLCTILKEKTNVVSERSCGLNRATGMSKGVKPEDLGRSFPLSTCIDERERHSLELKRLSVL